MTHDPNGPTDDWDDGYIDPADFAAEAQERPGDHPWRSGRHRKPDDHLVVSILVTLFCCQPLGIAAIVFSAMTMSANSSGDYKTAQRHARLANQFNAWGFGLGIAYLAFIVLIVILSAAGGA